MPALQGKPLCVSHSASKQGAGEVSSANYEARAFGVRAVMFIGEARRLCPNLIVMPYEFDKYEDISDKVSRFLFHHQHIFHFLSQLRCSVCTPEMILQARRAFTPL